MISVVVPTFNRSESLLVAINSILKTKNLNIEIIIIDDASEDDTQKKINLLNNKKIKYIKNDKNIGTAKSKLKGIEIAEGDYIGFLDDDDIWTTELINFESDISSHCDIILYNFQIHSKIDNTTRIFNLKKYQTNFEYNVAKTMGGIFMQACLFKKEFILLYKNHLDYKTTPSEDWDFFLTLAQDNPSIYHSNKIIFQWNLHKKSQSFNIEKETFALGHILYKHKSFLKKYKKLLSNHHRILANRLFYEKAYDQGERYIREAFTLYPYQIKNILFRCFILLPKTIRTPIHRLYNKKIL